MSPIARNKVFISYSHKDKKFLERLHTHLRMYERDGRIDYWDDTRLTPGSKWQDKISVEINCARIAVLLISADFLASDFVASHELPPLLDLAEQNGVRILMVILSPCNFQQTLLSSYQAINAPSNPLNGFHSASTKIRLLLRLKRYDQALLACEEAIVTYSSDVNLLNDKIAALEGMGMTSEARQAEQELLNLLKSWNRHDEP